MKLMTSVASSRAQAKAQVQVRASYSEAVMSVRPGCSGSRSPPGAASCCQKRNKRDRSLLDLFELTKEELAVMPANETLRIRSDIG